MGEEQKRQIEEVERLRRKALKKAEELLKKIDEELKRSGVAMP